MSAESAPEQRPGTTRELKTRPCERCGRPVAQNPAGGSPRRFCPDSADQPGTSCLELRKREQAALQGAGLDQLAAAFRTLIDQVQAAADPLRAPIAALNGYFADLDTLTERIEQAAGVRVAAAEQAQLQAEAAALAAQRDARAAEDAARRDRELRDDAFRARDDALENEDRVRQQARRDVDDARRRAEEAERARGQAEGAASEHRRALTDEQQRREAAEAAVGELRQQLDTARQENVVLVRERNAAWNRAVEDRKTIGDLQAQNATFTTRHQADQELLADRDRQVTELRDAGAAATARADRLAADLETLAREHTELERTVTRLGTDLEAARAAAEQDRVALTRQAESADRRYEDLLAALAGGGFAPTAGSGQ